MMEEHGIYHKRSQELIDWAYVFAKKAHGDQKRKYTGEPYITHPVAVANIVASVTTDCNMICAALLHDVIEDTDVTYEELISDKNGFRWPVANLVLEVTDVSKPSDGNRAARKEIDRQHLAKASAQAQTIKLADFIHNTESITKYDKDFAKVYMSEKKRVLEVLTIGDKSLHKIASDLVNRYFNENC